MSKVEIDVMSDIIIIEKFEDKKILIGSKLFCGCCGNCLGIAKQELTFPFKADVFESAMEHVSFERSKIGLRHKTCGHTMFGFGETYRFISMENYNLQSAANELAAQNSKLN